MYLVDSSVWIALFLDDDSQHAKAAEVMERIGDASIRVLYGVVLETTTTLARKQSKQQADKFVEYIRANPQIELVTPFPSRDVDMFLEESERLSFVDTLLKDMALRENITLVSFDTQLLNSLKQSKRHII